MNHRIASLLLLLGLGTASPAFAGDRTRTPPMLRGDVQLLYDGSVGFGRLVDRTVAGGTRTEVARSTRQQHRITLGGAFSPYHGIAVTLDLLPITLHDKRVFGSANDMRLDPDAGLPTMVGGSELPVDVLAGSAAQRNHVGFGDIRFGARAIAFAQDGVPGRQGPANLAFDLSVRVPTGGNHDRVRDNGTAGPGVGGPGLALGLTASRRIAGVEPYLTLAWELNGPYRQQLVDVDGAPTTPPVDPDAPNPDAEGRWTLDPAERFTVRFGAELLVMQNEEADTEARFDVGAAVTYVGPDEISVGRLLPAPLDATVGHLAVTGEHMVADVALGLRVRPIRLIEVRVDVGATWTAPHTIERIGEKAYGVETGTDTFGVHWGLAVRARIR
jgi:hypothetical protein